VVRNEICNFSIAGCAVGCIVIFAGVVLQPFRCINLSYSAVASDAILYTDNGESIIATRPDRVADLWELAIIDTRIFVTTLRSARGEVVGIGFKISSDSEQTSLINANAEVNSVWHVYLPGQGTFLIDQSENYWSYIHDIVIPARWSSGAPARALRRWNP